MPKVQVVNAQSIDGVYRKRDEVIDVSPGRARDLIAAGKARAVEDKPAEKAVAKPAEKAGK